MLSKIKYCFLWFAIFHFLIQTLCAKQNSHCSPSSCGSIRNISYPFRLKHDPSHCGNPDYELGCENNKTTFLTILSHKYIIKTINYSNYTIRLMDSSMDTHHNCSFPNHSLSRADFELQYLYRTQLYNRSRRDRDSHVITSTVTVMSCPSPANNPLLVDISPPTCVGRRRHTYVKLGNLNTSYLMEMCRIEMMTMTSSSWSLINDEKSVSLSEIHSSLVYGFELSWFNVLCEGKCRNCWLDGNRQKCDDGYMGCFIGTYWEFHCEPLSSSTALLLSPSTASEHHLRQVSYRRQPLRPPSASRRITEVAAPPMRCFFTLIRNRFAAFSTFILNPPCSS